MSEILVEFLDVGQGEGNLITTSNGFAIMVDFGNFENTTIEMRYLQRAVAALKEAATKRGSDQFILDYLFISHPDQDHYNKFTALMAAVAEATRKPLLIKRVVIASSPSNYKQGNFKAEVLDPAKAANTLEDFNQNRFHNVVDGSKALVPWARFDVGGLPLDLFVLSANVPVGDARAEVKGPVSRVGTTANVASLVVKLSFTGVTVTFPGDAERGTEGSIIHNYTREGALPVLKTYALKFGHHGSRIGMSDEWLDATDPRATFASAAVRWSHPYCEVTHRVLNPQGPTRTPPDKLFQHWWSCGEGSGATQEYTNTNNTDGVYTNILYYKVKEDDAAVPAKAVKPRSGLASSYSLKISAAEIVYFLGSDKVHTVKRS